MDVLATIHPYLANKSYNTEDVFQIMALLYRALGNFFDGLSEYKRIISTLATLAQILESQSDSDHPLIITAAERSISMGRILAQLVQRMADYPSENVQYLFRIVIAYVKYLLQHNAGVLTLTLTAQTLNFAKYLLPQDKDFNYHLCRHAIQLLKNSTFEPIDLPAGSFMQVSLLNLEVEPDHESTVISLYGSLKTKIIKTLDTMGPTPMPAWPDYMPTTMFGMSPRNSGKPEKLKTAVASLNTAYIASLMAETIVDPEMVFQYVFYFAAFGGTLDTRLTDIFSSWYSRDYAKEGEKYKVQYIYYIGLLLLYSITFQKSVPGDFLNENMRLNIQKTLEVLSNDGRMRILPLEHSRELYLQAKDILQELFPQEITVELSPMVSNIEVGLCITVPKIPSARMVVIIHDSRFCPDRSLYDAPQFDMLREIIEGTGSSFLYVKITPKNANTWQKTLRVEVKAWYNQYVPAVAPPPLGPSADFLPNSISPYLYTIEILNQSKNPAFQRIIRILWNPLVLHDPTNWDRRSNPEEVFQIRKKLFAEVERDFRKEIDQITAVEWSNIAYLSATDTTPMKRGECELIYDQMQQHAKAPKDMYRLASIRVS